MSQPSFKSASDLMQDAWTELCKANPLRPSPAQESQCESVAAPAAAVQGEGTLRVMLERGFLNDFHCWLLDNVSEPVSHIEVLMQFKRERGL